MPAVPPIKPIRIVGFDQRELPFPAPFLDQLLARDGWFDPVKTFRIDQSRLAKFCGVDRTYACPVLPDPPEQVGSDTDDIPPR